MPTPPASLPSLPAVELHALLAVSFSALALWRPLYGPDGAAVTDFACEYLNPAGQQMLGQPERPEQTFLTLFPNACENGLITCCCRVFATGEAGHFEANHPADGRDNYWHLAARRGGELLATSFTDPAGETTLRANHRAEARQAELLAAAQRRAQEREEFAQVFAHTPAAICIQCGPAHRYAYVNAAYQQFFPDRQLLGRPVAEALPETVDAGVVDLLDAVYRTGETYYGHEQPLLVARPGGQAPKPMYFTFTYQAYRENGEVVGISTFAFDVTEQVLARQERERQRQQLEDLFMQASAPIVVLDGPDHVFTLVNPAYQRFFPGRELQGKPLRDALPELADTPVPTLLRQVYTSGETCVAEEMPLQMARSAGGPLEEMYWTFSFQAHRDAHGDIDGIRAFAQDVTASVRARQQLQEANQALTESNRQLTRTNTDLDNFIYTASHDLKAPITNLEGLLHLLQRVLPLPARQQEGVQPVLDRMQQSVDRFQLTIAQLTDLTKLQRAAAEPAEPVDLARLIEDVCLDLAPQFAATEARLTVDVTGGPRLAFAPKNLRSLVYNLLSNAVKYHQPGRPPVVHLRSHRTENGAAVLEVQDNGLGLNARQQAKLFGLFRRLHDHVEGSGIGLYMVKRIVENAGGTIAVSSTPGIGSTFTITLPGTALPETTTAV
ncbi:PAS domain-containing sensor histidine kinase [Hymenobacter sp. BT683]|uniref:histidine kinase n=1 Tax=Hymenobacter jeongseonensis TaxID=2791027 RepID=A0ABS0IMZ3_9BACT|nr:PAS domain-containing sensor histidine kinase [Hymenobacter jeongseonensis]MBF9239740.1 PAS domain-containing sensor histidine kinase [Hymenobacter jeongseonensis]